MSSQRTPGQQLLARVAWEYRAHPESWSRRGFGTIGGFSVIGVPGYLTALKMKTICPDVALIRFASQYGGEPAIDEARAIFWAQLWPGVPHNGSSGLPIWAFNDKRGRTLEQVIDRLDRAAGYRLISFESKPAVQQGPIGRTLEKLGTALIVFALFFGS